MSEDVVEGTVEDKGIYLVINGEHFKCRKVSVSWQMMNFAAAQKKARSIHVPEHLPEDDSRRKDAEERRNAAGLDAMVAMQQITLKLLKPEERERFDTFMAENDVEPGVLEEAIGDVIAAIGAQDDDKGKAQQSPSPSSTSDMSTNANFQGGSSVVELEAALARAKEAEKVSSTL